MVSASAVIKTKAQPNATARAAARVLQWVWKSPERRRKLLLVAFGGTSGALACVVLRETFRGVCQTPWEIARLLLRLAATLSVTLARFVARGCKTKFPDWTLRFEIMRAMVREVTGAFGERFSDAKYARVIRDQSAAVGSFSGWFSCREHERRVEPVHMNDMEHIWLRSSRPRRGNARRFVVMYVHGGGYTVLSPRFYISFGASLASAIEKELRGELKDKEEVQVDVFLSNYRKAPEHCFPTPPNDVVAAYEHLLETEGLLPEQIILAGDSAGGGLVMSALLRVRKAAKARLPLAAILLSPAIDLSGDEALGDSAASSENCLLSPELVGAVRMAYHPTPDDPETWEDASSAHCDLRGLPPVFLQAASLDYLFPHSMRLAQKAATDGVTNWELDVHTGLPHVFAIVPPSVLPYARVGVQKMAGFAARHFVAASREAFNNATAAMY